MLVAPGSAAAAPARPAASGPLHICSRPAVRRLARALLLAAGRCYIYGRARVHGLRLGPLGGWPALSPLSLAPAVPPPSRSLPSPRGASPLCATDGTDCGRSARRAELERRAWLCSAPRQPSSLRSELPDCAACQAAELRAPARLQLPQAASAVRGRECAARSGRSGCSELPRQRSLAISERIFKRQSCCRGRRLKSPIWPILMGNICR